VVTLLLVRHGETDWNRNGRWQGRRGEGLNETGRSQAADLAAQLDSVDAIYSSDSIRALETAEILKLAVV
jgi:probable phosphoglycerate mutase